LRDERQDDGQYAKVMPGEKSAIRAGGETVAMAVPEGVPGAGL